MAEITALQESYNQTIHQLAGHGSRNFQVLKEAFQNIIPQPSSYNYFSNEINELKNWDLIQEKITNDFENFVFEKYPEVKNIKEMMYENGALFSLMSGSGSTVYGVFENYNAAKKTSDKFSSNYLKIISNQAL